MPKYIGVLHDHEFAIEKQERRKSKGTQIQIGLDLGVMFPVLQPKPLKKMGRT